MKILENINTKLNSGKKNLESISSKKINRKNFIFYSGITLAGAYILLKSPLNIIRNKKDTEKISENNQNEIQFNINPNAVKRASRGNNG